MSDTAAHETPLLFTPLKIRGMVSKNRIGVSPMCQYLSVDGGPTDWHLVHLGRLAVGGAGIIFCEETAVEPRGRKTYGCAGLWNDSHVVGYRRINDFIKQFGAVPAIQLGHSGAKASSHGAIKDWKPITEENAEPGMPPWQGIAPSPVPDTPKHALPKEMDLGDIRSVVGKFAEAAQRSLDAGFEVIEIHGAHGYLIHQFLSPLRNKRTDAYGGSREGRMRFPLEIVEAVRKVIPSDMPLFFRVSAVDGKGGVWNLDDSVALSRELKRRDVDVVDCSSGGIFGDTTMPIVPRVPNFQVGFARRIREEAEVMTAAVGLITKPSQAEQILQDGSADLVLLARELMLHSEWPAFAARELGVPNWYDTLPAGYAHRLKRREDVAKLSINRAPDTLAHSEAMLIEST